MNTDQSGSTPGRRVHWVDNTLTQDGWQIRYVSQGASLRCVPTVQANSTQTCWLASVRHSRRKLEDTRIKRPLNSMLKMLQRGAAPPIHPGSEQLLLESLGHRCIENSILPDDISPVIDEEVEIPDSTQNLISHTPYALRKDITESDREIQFVEWVNSKAPWATPWLIPQPSLEQMVAKTEEDIDGSRRCDFLFALPGQENFVVEIDGGQHRSQTQVDDKRDSLLLENKVTTIRVPVDELDADTGPGLKKILAKLREGEFTFSVNHYLWVPVQLHRLILAICEAVKVGFLNGPSWCISVSDPIKSSVMLLGPYLRLLNAIYNLWGLGTYFPKTITIYADNIWYKYSQENNWECSKGGQAEKFDVQISLECDHSPFEDLPSVGPDDAPVIVVRSSGIQFKIANTAEDGPMRAITEKTDVSENDLTEVLQAVFAKKVFREGQYRAIVEIISGGDATVLLPTGAGKSLIYQLAGLLLPGCTIIVDPIIALIEDQLRGLELYGIDKALGISKDTTSRGETERLQEIIGKGEAYFIFIAPERFQMEKFRDTISRLVQFTPINIAVIDEAHCVSEWGHDFRTSYLTLGRTIRDHSKSLLEKTNPQSDEKPESSPLLALTGTASRVVLRDILFQLGMNKYKSHTTIKPDSFDRPELNFEIRVLDSRTSGAALAGIVEGLPARFDESHADFFRQNGNNTYSGLVFVPTVNGPYGIDSTVKQIKPTIPRIGIYSGKAPKSQSREVSWGIEKRKTASKFITNEISALVTTNAFGMGIDKPNVRWVIHYGLPRSMESYYQEVGRCGRDRRDAKCVFLLSEYDFERNRRLLSLDTSSQLSPNTPWERRDHITTALWFHDQNFPGIEKEVSDIIKLADKLSLFSSVDRDRYNIGVPITKDNQERALHRLTILGIVEDYLKDFGSRKFKVWVRRIDENSLVQNFLNYVDRNQPGGRDSIELRLPQNFPSFKHALEECARELILFVYDTVASSRLRSLREVWLAAHECRDGEDFRNRILNYLTEGTAQRILEEIVESNIKISNWVPYWREISKDDVSEWRGTAARLLESYPDNIGLLITRGLVEALGEEPHSATEHSELRENIIQGLKIGKESNIPNEEFEKTLHGILSILNALGNDDAIVVLIRAILNEGYKFNVIENYLKEHSGKSEKLLELYTAYILFEQVTYILNSATSISRHTHSIYS